MSQKINWPSSKTIVVEKLNKRIDEFGYLEVPIMNDIDRENDITK